MEKQGQDSHRLEPELRDSPGATLIQSVNPTEEWQREFPIARVWSIVTYTVANFGAAVAIWLIGQPILAAALIVAAVTGGLGAVYWWRERLAIMRSDDALHGLTHWSRDGLHELLSVNSRQTAAHLAKKFVQTSVEHIAAIFRARLRDPSIGCCIRLAEVTDGTQQYVTWARTSNLDEEREQYSEPLSIDEPGLARSFHLQRQTGAYLIRDLGEAVRQGIWKPGRNDSRPDAKTYLVCPVNGWVAGRRAMIGVLHLTSRNDSFRPSHWLLMKAVADLLGQVLPRAMAAVDDSDLDAADERYEAEFTD